MIFLIIFFLTISIKINVIGLISHTDSLGASLMSTIDEGVINSCFLLSSLVFLLIIFFPETHLPSNWSLTYRASYNKSCNGRSMANKVKCISKVDYPLKKTYRFDDAAMQALRIYMWLEVQKLVAESGGSMLLSVGNSDEIVIRRRFSFNLHVSLLSLLYSLQWCCPILS